MGKGTSVSGFGRKLETRLAIVSDFREIPKQMRTDMGAREQFMNLFVNSDREHLRVQDRELVGERLFVSASGVRARVVFVSRCMNSCS